MHKKLTESTLSTLTTLNREEHHVTLQHMSVLEAHSEEGVTAIPDISHALQKKSTNDS